MRKSNMSSEKSLEDNLFKLIDDNLNLIRERLEKEEGLSPEDAIRDYFLNTIEPVLLEKDKSLPNYNVIIQRVMEKAYLSLLIHTELYPKIQAVRAQEFPNQEKMTQDIIQSYANTVSKKFNGLPDMLETIQLIVKEITRDEECYIVLLEDLRKNLKTLGEEEGISPEVLKKHREDFITNFERNLHKRYKGLPNYKKIMRKHIEDIMEEKEK